ncbi:MAG: malate dehydrogenase, partial [Chloroflexi bacterium]|nr:malate dehydrogenase [Chloroflexota bacterium]
MRSKVTVVGAGNVGATTAQRIYERGYADVVLVDVVEDMPQGKALDILESGPVLGTDAQITGANDYEPTAGSDVVVITAGIARRPGMSRDDLLLTNMRIMQSVTEQVIKYSP